LQANRKAADLSKFLQEQRRESNTTQRAQLERYQREIARIQEANEATVRQLGETQDKCVELSDYVT
jgi:hypothetical protein